MGLCAKRFHFAAWFVIFLQAASLDLKSMP